SGRTSDFSGVVRVISTKSATEEPRRPGVVGLCLRIPMRFDPHLSLCAGDQPTGPPKMSRVPSRRVTMARLVSLRLPTPKRVRWVLPCRFIVFTEETFTSKIFSTATLISVLFERGSTRKVYLPSSRRLQL